MQDNLNKIQKIGFLAAASIVIANMVGTGVFTSLGFQVVEIKSVFAILMLWLIGGLIALTGALSYGELASALPRSGGEYHFLGRIYHPLVGFLAGWVSILIGFSAPTALAAMAMASYASQIIPLLPESIFAAAVVVVLSLVHSYNIKTGSRFQVIVTVIKILLILFFILAGLLSGHPAPKVLPIASDWQYLLSSGFAISLIYVSYSFSGWNATVYIADEIEKPQKNVPLSLLSGTLLVTILYLFLNYIFLSSSSFSALEGKIEVGFIAARNIFGETGGNMMAGIITLLLISTVSAMIWIGPRVSMVMGQDYRMLKFLGDVNPYRVPVKAIWFQSAITLLMIFTSTFDKVLVYSGFVLNLFTLLTVVGLFVLRIREPDLERPYKVWGYPWVPVFFILLSIWTLVFLAVEKPLESILGFLTVVIGWLFYWLDQRKRSP